jgi:hypothetical protein
VSESRPEKPGVGFWLTVAAATLALPVAILTTCQVRGAYVHPPGEYHPVSAEIHGLASIFIGIDVGLPLTGALIWAAIRLQRRKPPDGPPTG